MTDLPTDHPHSEPVPSRRPGTVRFRLRRVLLLLLAVSVGALVGIGSFTFRYAEGLSYFSTDPAACVNCHIMRPQYDSWQKSSHRGAAMCVECHLPEAFVPKYIAKAENGYRHAKEFTAGTFVEPIVAKPRAREILEENCVRCHGALVAELHVDLEHTTPGEACVRCHFGVGHGEPARLGGPLRPAEISILERP